MFPSADTEDILQVTSLPTKPGAARNAQNSIENTQVATQRSNRELTFNMLIKEIVFCIALAITTYGALHNAPTKISKHPQAIQFFQPESVVKDWYRGQLSHALASINKVDIAFVMYYAPWDAESQYVRGEFEKAASVLNDHVLFSAINCWNPGSECRLQNNKIPSWPILMVYTTISRGVLYKGPRDAHSMVNFLELMMKPLKRVSSSEDLVNLLSRCDAVAVGYTPLTETSKYYNVWYRVALKVREADTLGEICFAVVTSEELASHLGVQTVPNARLMLWNYTKEYIKQSGDIHTWNDSSLINWILNHFDQPVARIVPMWKKDFNFERYVDGNPILILFTPLNPLNDQLPLYGLMREVAMEYYSCKNSESKQWTTELVKLQQVQRLLYQQKNYTKFCNEFNFNVPVKKHKIKKGIESHNNKYPWYNSTKNNEKYSAFNSLLKRDFSLPKVGESADNSQLLSSLDWLEECSMKVFPAEKVFYDHYKQCQTLENSNHLEQELTLEPEEVETTMLPFEDDSLSPKNLIQDSIKHFCKITRFANEWGQTILPRGPSDAEERQNMTKIEGIACSHNFTLHMIAVDSVRNHHFAESLGIDIRNRKDMTAVVILDSKPETQYLLTEDFNARSIREFIYNFTKKSLKRTMRSRVDDTAHTHYFGSDGETEQMGVNENSLHITDLTSNTFRRMIKTPGTLTMVAVCGGACGALTTRALLQARRLLGACGVRVRLARLDALRHDLPWQYTQHRYPTLLVFHADRRDGRAYPGGARVSAGGAAALALRALSAPLRLRLRLVLCAQLPALTEKKTCLKDVKQHVTTVIGRNLKYWRRTETQSLKNALLKRLQYLHELSLYLCSFHVQDLSANSTKQTSLVTILSDLSKHWDINVSALVNSSTTASRTTSS